MGASRGMYSSNRESNGKGFALFSAGAIGLVSDSVPELAWASARDVPHDGQMVLCSANSLPQRVHTIISRLFPGLCGHPFIVFYQCMYHSVSCVALYCPVLTITGDCHSTCLRRLVYLPCSTDRLE